MNIEELTEYCQSLKQVTVEVLWENVLVFKVGGKMFCFVPMDEAELKMNLKCDPVEALELRERFPAVLPGYHMNKKYWNTVLIDGSVNDSLLQTWIEKSYWLVVEKLSRGERLRLGL
ncbi:MAG: MmcQ/YjbR family DNA-binding protein [Odoribacter sp.]|nr:MmcQ/YjbR family DNA-binding protein [Odoribacter sp.]